MGLRAELADVLRLAAGRDATPVVLRAGAFFATGLAVAAFLAPALVGALFVAAALVAVALFAVALVAVAFFAVPLDAVVFLAALLVAVAFLAALLVAVAFFAALLVATVFFAVALVAVVLLAAAFDAVGFAAVAFFAAAAGLAEAFLAGALPATVVDFAAFAVVDFGLAVVARTVAFAAAESAGETRLADGFGVRVVVVFADVLRAPDLAVAFGAEAVLAGDLAAPDFVPAGRDDEADLLAAGRTEARLAAGLVAEADFASADFEAVGFATVVPAFLEAVAVVAAFFAAGLPAAAPVARFCDAAGLSAVVVLVPARLAAGLVGAFVAAAIGMFPPCE